MVEIGKFSRLTVTKRRDFGVFLEGERLGEILLPKRDVPDGCKIGDSIDVFIYLDSDDELIATTQTPKACAGEVAYLQADEVNTIGAFLNWGLPKDLLAPYSNSSVQWSKANGNWFTSHSTNTPTVLLPQVNSIASLKTKNLTLSKVNKLN
jgi:predicted RNA-binding protein (virulence factor B family)